MRELDCNREAAHTQIKVGRDGRFRERMLRPSASGTKKDYNHPWKTCCFVKGLRRSPLSSF